MTLNVGKIAFLCLIWTAFILLGISAGLNVPFLLALVGSVLYLLF